MVVIAAAVVGSLSAVGIVMLLDGGKKSGAGRAANGPAVSSTAPPIASKASVSEPTVSPSALAVTPSAPMLEQVQVIQAPATGGDPSVSFCLVYTGTSSGPVRDAILLMNAPAGECHDLLPYNPDTGAFRTQAPECAAPTRPAVVSFDEMSGWRGEVLYTCLTRHHGA
ncbi:hypothetical protein GCM10010319_67350 [Streptomyces blastmyceticus]|uniref:Uncharacterized protein n=1 Tax=Streptomyces blastmyceticus TaxID=68180 RepID=A0ABN0Y0S7_9ACTN